MEMQILCYRTNRTKNFDCCSRYRNKIWFFASKTGAIDNLDSAAVLQAVTKAYQHREKDIVTDMARACSFVNPKHLYCDLSEMFTCPGASEACMKVIHDYYSGKENGVDLIAEASLELDNFRTFSGWFGEEVTRSLAVEAEPSQFWSVALGHGKANALALMA